MRPKLTRLRVAVGAGVVAALGAGGGLVVAWARDSPPEPPPQVTGIAVAEDTYLDGSGRDHSTEPELLAGGGATAYLKFEVPAVGGSIRSVRLTTGAGGEARVRRVPDTTWVAGELVDTGAPATGPVVATGTGTFDLSDAVTGDGTYAFAIEADAALRIPAAEHADGGARLTVTWVADRPGGPAQGFQPGTADSARARLGGSGSAVPSGSSAAGPLPAVPRGRTLAGASLQLQPGETYAQGVARADRTYGPMEMVRVFYPGLPPAWKGSRADVAGRTTVVSFKAHPRDINAGRHDAQLAAWFAGVNRQRDTYWVYFHEPEDDVENGSYTAADYRSAWRRLAGLAARAGNPRLYPTLVLMCYTLNPQSGRNWRDFYPGDDVIAVLGWDCYNFSGRNGSYASPESIFARSAEVSRSVGKPFGYAEMGSQLVPGDSGAARAAWLRAVGAYYAQINPVWAAYFDVKLDIEYRLLDAPSQQAWQAVCRS